MLYWIKTECQCFLAIVMSQAGKESDLTLRTSWLVLLTDPVLAVPLSNASCLLSTRLLKRVHTEALCSAIDTAQFASQMQNHPVLLVSDLAKPNFQAPAVGHFNLFGSWMLRRNLCSSHSRLVCMQCSPKNPVCQEYFWTILDVSNSILEVISQSLNCISTWLNYLQSSCGIKYRSS